MSRTISDWQSRDPSDCECNDEPAYGNNCDTDNTPDWQFFLVIFLLLGVIVAGFLFMMQI